MGCVIQRTCNSCGKKEEYFLGCGRKDFEPETVLSHFEESDRDEASRWMEKGHWSFERKLTRCRKCHRITATPSLRVQDGGGQWEEFLPPCKCKGVVEVLLSAGQPLDGLQKAVPCEECGGAVRTEMSGYWD